MIPAPKRNVPLSRTGFHAPRLRVREREALKLVEGWFEEHPRAWVSFSGGKDSGVCVDLARRVNPDVPVAFFDSGLEFPQNLAYIRRVAGAWNLDLHEFKATPTALELLRESGQLEHGVPKVKKDDLQDALITRPLAAARERFGDHSIYGLRAEESSQRYALLAKNRGVVGKKDKHGDGGTVSLAPIWQWDFKEVHSYFGYRGIEANPLYAQQAALGLPLRSCRVGLLVDGNAMHRGRWAMVRQLAPDAARLVETHLPGLAQYR